MGCDIHCYLERKQKNGKKWIFVEEINIWRNYTLFAVLADVRNYSVEYCSTTIRPISLPRGLPEDLSAGVKKELKIWNGDAHSMTWYPLQELCEKLSPSFKEYFGTLFDDYTTDEQCKNMRLIIWFDN